MNLQLFATLTTATNTLAPEIKQYYDTLLLKNMQNETYFEQFAKKQPLPKNHGTSVEWRRMVAFAPATTPLTEGVTPTERAITVSHVTVDLNQYGDYARFSDKLQMEAIDPLIAEATVEFSHQAAQTMDVVTRDALVTGANVVFGGGKNDRATIETGDVLTLPLVDQIATFLKKQNAPKINGSYIAIVHPSVAYDIRQANGWIEVQKYKNPEAIYRGEVGTLAGVRFIESNNVKVWDNGTVKVYGCLFFGADAYGEVDPEGEGLEMIVKPLGAGDDPLNQRSTVGWKGTTAAAILYPERLVRCEVTSALQANDSVN